MRCETFWGLELSLHTCFARILSFGEEKFLDKQQQYHYRDCWHSFLAIWWVSSFFQLPVLCYKLSFYFSLNGLFILCELMKFNLFCRHYVEKQLKTRGLKNMLENFEFIFRSVISRAYSVLHEPTDRNKTQTQRGQVSSSCACWGFLMNHGSWGNCYIFLPLFCSCSKWKYLGLVNYSLHISCLGYFVEK